MDAGTPPDHVGLRGLHEQGMACPHWHCRAWARGCVRSGPGGEDLPAEAWRRGPPRSVRGYPARHLAGQAKTLARGRLRAVVVDGKTARGARQADGIRVHLLGAAEHLLDHLEVGVKHNETSHFTELLEPLGLAGAVVTSDASCRAGEPGLAGEGQESPLRRDRRACFTLLLLLVMACQRVQPGRVRPGYGALCGVLG
jgi:hypothetical protein